MASDPLRFRFSWPDSPERLLFQIQLHPRRLPHTVMTPQEIAISAVKTSEASAKSYSPSSPPLRQYNVNFEGKCGTFGLEYTVQKLPGASETDAEAASKRQHELVRPSEAGGNYASAQRLFAPTSRILSCPTRPCLSSGNCALYALAFIIPLT